MSTTAELDALISKIRQSRAFIQGAMPQVAAAVGEALRATARAGISPMGSPWAPRKEDGGRALSGAAEAINVRVVGTSVVASISKPESIHNEGTSDIPKRQILPSVMTPGIRDAIQKALIAAWEAK